MLGYVYPGNGAPIASVWLTGGSGGGGSSTFYSSHRRRGYHAMWLLFLIPALSGVMSCFGG